MVEHLSARLRSVPLRVKLVAAVLALVSAALVLIAVASTFALRMYQYSRLDDELKGYTKVVVEGAQLSAVSPHVRYSTLLPHEYRVRETTIAGVVVGGDEGGSTEIGDQPPVITGEERIQARLADEEPFDVVSVNGKVRWHMIIADLPNGHVVQVARATSDLELAVRRLVIVDLLVGAAVLVALAGVGAAIVRTSLRPLVEIEQTAGAIAAGDLTRRVPDPEPGVAEPETELGRLSRALNAMLAQIEMAFMARAESEAAARTAEAVARDAAAVARDAAAAAQQSAAAAQESEARALRSEDRMRQFVADASHELRTPLTTIRGFAELYRQGAAPTPEDVARLMRRIEDEASRMGLLVEDLLLLARLDRERPLVLAPVELPVLAADAVQAAKVTAPERTIDLDVQGEPETLVVLGDDARLRQVIGNLVTNALVHTPAGASVTVRLRPRLDRVVLEVADTGPGLTPEQRERVFERFYRADAARTRRVHPVTGTGLGLAIVSAIVAAHDGQVEVDSGPGHGAVFRVLLPVAAGADDH